MTRSVTPLRTYMQHRGLFARIARRLKLDPSYVSRVAKGQRRSEKIRLALEADLNKMYPVRRGGGKFGKRKRAAV